MRLLDDPLAHTALLVSVNLDKYSSRTVKDINPASPVARREKAEVIHLLFVGYYMKLVQWQRFFFLPNTA